jgi:hypothetical protein
MEWEAVCNFSSSKFPKRDRKRADQKKGYKIEDKIVTLTKNSKIIIKNQYLKAKH